MPTGLSYNICMDQKTHNQFSKSGRTVCSLNQEVIMTNSVKLSKDQLKSLDSCTTTSSRIRYLNSIGWPRAAIAKKLNKRYQHVRNVLITPVTTPRQ